MLLVPSYRGDTSSVAEQLRRPEAKVLAPLPCAQAFPEEIHDAIAQNEAVNLDRRMLPQAIEFPLPGRADAKMFKLLFWTVCAGASVISSCTQRRNWENGRFFGEDDSTCKPLASV